MEHDPLEILQSVRAVIRKVISAGRISPSQIAAIGITNQRETTVLWDKETGKPVHRALVWQDRRTVFLCDRLKKAKLEPLIRKRTGLVLDPYFSGTKIQWLLENVAGLRRKASAGKILFGTMDTWLLWNLTGRKVHATDATNASRTLLFNLLKKTWDPQILKLLKIPASILPEVRSSAADYGQTVRWGSLPGGLPVSAMVGDQQAALFGQGCYKAGESKNTYGTGCFLLMNEGQHYRPPSRGLLGTLACDKKGQPCYALEGAVFIAGAVVQWIRDGLKFIKKASETETIAKSLPDTGGVTLIPAFTGLGAPYWDPEARGAILGLTRGTTRAHLIKAALDSIAYQTADVFDAMVRACGRKPAALKVDGGASANHYLMQFQADLLGIPVISFDRPELTAWGAAKLAGLQSGFWKTADSADRKVKRTIFTPRMTPAERTDKIRRWRQAVQRILTRERF